MNTCSDEILNLDCSCKILYHRYHDWSMSNISAVVKVTETDGKIKVYINDVDKTHVKEEIFKTIGWRP